MKRLLPFALLPLLFFTGASAYDGLTLYGTNLSRRDRVNSSGAPLHVIREILQQDRANYYKFKRRDPEDQPDGFFTSAKSRRLFNTAQIRIDPRLEARILKSDSILVTVWVYDEHHMEVTAGLPPENAD